MNSEIKPPEGFVLNPEYERAQYGLHFSFYPDAPSELDVVGQIRTNNPHFVRDGAKASDVIPEYIKIK